MFILMIFNFLKAPPFCSTINKYKTSRLPPGRLLCYAPDFAPGSPGKSQKEGQEDQGTLTRALEALRGLIREGLKGFIRPLRAS